MSKKINNFVVYTALFGAYDRLASPPKKNRNCDYICFTDQANVAPGWKVIKVESGNESPTIMNRKFKILPHKYLSQYSSSLYVDSNIKICKDPSVIIEKYLAYCHLACPKHFERDCTFLEINECVRLGKISQHEGEVIEEKYKTDNFPKKYGLAENNIIIRKHNDQKLIELMEHWWESFLAGPKRDQLSLMYLCWKEDFPIAFMIESSRNKNHYFSYKSHNLNMSLLEKAATYLNIKKERYTTLKNIYGALKSLKENNAR